LRTLTAFTILLLASSIAVARPVVPVGTPSDQTTTQTQTATVPTSSLKPHQFKFTPKDLWEIDGRMPPKVVLTFLEHPTMENALRYLAWSKERTKKLNEALALLRKIEQEQVQKKLSKIPLSRINNSKIVMIFSPSCPYCLRELQIIKEIKEKYPHVGLELYPVSNPFLAEARLKNMGLEKYINYSSSLAKLAKNVTAIPYILVMDKNNNTVKARFVGVTSYEKIISSM